MDKIISCEFNIDTSCVEVKYADGSRSPSIAPESKTRLPGIYTKPANWIYWSITHLRFCVFTAQW